MDDDYIIDDFEMVSKELKPAPDDAGGDNKDNEKEAP